MTYEEAKFWFESTLESGEWLTPAEEEYYKVAAECIEKQIPKKPKMIPVKHYGEYEIVDGTMKMQTFMIDLPHCPKCGRRLQKRERCKTNGCEAIIDWSEVE